MKTLLPNVNTSEGCFEIGVTISNPTRFNHKRTG